MWMSIAPSWDAWTPPRGSKSSVFLRLGGNNTRNSPSATCRPMFSEARTMKDTTKPLHLPRLHLKTVCESYEQNAQNKWLPSVPSDLCCYYNIFVLCCPLITLVTFCVCVCVSLQMTHTIKLLRRSWRFPTRSRTPVWTRRTQRSRIKEDEEETCTWHEGQAGD